MCDNLDGPNAPFCSPSTNSQIQVGRTLEITWDPRFFNRTSSLFPNEVPPKRVYIQADFGQTSNDPSFGGLDGFTSPPLNPQDGRFTWTILDSFLTSGGSSTTSRGSRLFLASESIAIDQDTGEPLTSIRRFTGPRVVIRSRDGNTSGQGGGSGQGQPNPLSIALPVGLGALVVLIIGIWFCVRRWRNRDRNMNGNGRAINRDVEMKAGNLTENNNSGLFGRMFNNTGGYGIGKSKSQRLGGTGIGQGNGSGSGGGWGGGGAGKKKKGKGNSEDIEIVHSTHMNAVGGVTGGPVRMGFMGGGSSGGAGGYSGGNVFRDEVRRQDRGRRTGDYL